MKNKTFEIRDRDFMEIIHKAYPDGVEYAKKVMNLALELSDAASPFYNGVFLSGYGVFPFLQVEAMEYVEDHLHSMQIIIASKFDKDELCEWVNSLSLTQEEKCIIKNDIKMSYKESDSMLDMKYIDLMTYLVETMKALQRTRDERHLRMQEILKMNIGYSDVVVFDSSLTKNYLRKKLKAYNDKEGKAKSRFFIVSPYPGLERACIVSCIEQAWKN